MDYTFQNFPEPGLVLDTVKLLTMKLNPDHTWIQSLLLPSTYQQDEATIKAQLSLYPSPNHKLYLFVHLSKTKPSCYLTHLLLKQLEESFDNFTFHRFLCIFDDIKLIKNSLFSHYLGPQDYTNVDLESIIRHDDSIPDKIKVLLLGFILNPQKYLTSLKKYLSLYYASLSKTNRNLSYATLDTTTLKSLLNSSRKDSEEFLSSLPSPTIRYSICTSVPNFLLFGRSPYLWFIFAENSISEFAETPSTLATDYILHLGDALRNSSRLSIIRQLQSNPSLLMEDLIKYTGLANSTLLHHLSILKKARLINEHKQKKRSIYALNPDGFTYASKILLNIIKEDTPNENMAPTNYNTDY